MYSMRETIRRLHSCPELVFYVICFNYFKVFLKEAENLRELLLGA